MKRGHYRLARGWLDHAFFNGSEYCPRAAWVWLIEHAAYAPCAVEASGRTIQLRRGQLAYSVRFLAHRWKWSKSRVHRYLSDLEQLRQISRGTDSGTDSGTPSGTVDTVISICNYDRYQLPNGSDGTPSGTDSGTPAGTNKKEREKKEREKKDAASIEAPPLQSVNAATDSADTVRDAIAAYLLGRGTPKSQCFGFLGKLRKTFTYAEILEVSKDAQRLSVAEPKAWMARALQERKRRQEAPPQFGMSADEARRQMGLSR